MGIPQFNRSSQSGQVGNVSSEPTLQDVASELGSHAGIVGGTISPGGTGSTFASQSVPQGFGVVIQNDPANTDSVAIQDDGGTDRHVLDPGASFTVFVEDLDQITVTGTANNPTVHATVEAP